MEQDDVLLGRNFLKGYSAKDEGKESPPSDQAKGIPMPPVQRDPKPGQLVFDLPPISRGIIRTPDLLDCIARRRSHRTFKDEPLSLAELSFLLWATQGVRTTAGRAVLRNVPSAGNRHPLDAWLAVFNVEGLESGLYRYLPLGHQLVLESLPEGLAERLAVACYGQTFVSKSAVCFLWTVVPYRTEWRYLARQHKAILEDAGHVCQNLYLAAEAIGCGTCAIGAYVQEECDALLGVDGEDEFTLYIAPVGRVDAPAE